VCTKELCTFRDWLAQLDVDSRANAQVYGISVDTFFTLKAFQDQQHYNFPLLSDFNKQAIRDYGVFNEDMIGLKGIARRAVFVIDKDGVVRYKEVLDDARNEPDYGKVLSTLQTLS
jgi:peroxiredoxin